MVKKSEEPKAEAAEESAGAAMDPAALERIEEIAQSADIDVDGMADSVRDTMLEIFKHRPKPWSAMNQAEQRDVATAVSQAVNATIVRACAIIAGEGRANIEARLEKFGGKGGKYQATLVAQGGPELAAKLAELDGHSVLIISADASRFTRPTSAPKLEPDQRPLELDEESPFDKPAEEPSGEGEGDEED